MNIWYFEYFKLRKQRVCMSISIVESDDSDRLFFNFK